MNILPGPSPLRLLSDVPAIRRNPSMFLLDCTRRYGDLTCFKLGSVTIFFVNHPEGVKHILLDNHHNYSKDTIQYNALAAVTGRGLLTSDEPAWLGQRRLVQPAFAQPFDLDLLPGQTVVMDALVTLRPHGGLPMQVRRVD
jgi:cytochrome P450